MYLKGALKNTIHTHNIQRKCNYNLKFNVSKTSQHDVLTAILLHMHTQLFYGHYT